MNDRVIAGRYELTAPIGHGGMGEVWRGYDRALDRVVAVKLLLAERMPFGAPDDRAKRRFQHECRVTARLEHPGVPAVYDTGVDGDDLYLVMQLIRGETLDRVRGEHDELPGAWVAAVGAQLAGILAAAHAIGLVHRDIKPSNIMLTVDGTVTLLDFGIAILLDPDFTRLTGAGEMPGSVRYMSPEQAGGGRPGPATDLYALGCVLFELAAGDPPFDDEEPNAVLLQHLHASPPDLATLRPDLPRDLIRLISELLGKEADERPDADRTYERLLPLLPRSGTVTSTHDPTAPYRRPLAPRRSQPRPPGLVAEPAPAPAEDTLKRVHDLVDDQRFTQAADLLTSMLTEASRHGDLVQARELRFDLASTLLLGDDYARALPHLEQLITELPHDDPMRVACRQQAATCLGALGRHTEALDAFRGLVDDMQEVDGVDPADMFAVRTQIALELAAAGDFDQARSQLRRLLADQRRILGPDAQENDQIQQLLRHFDTATQLSMREAGCTDA
jgi:serine/threonine protein kinase